MWAARFEGTHTAPAAIATTAGARTRFFGGSGKPGQAPQLRESAQHLQRARSSARSGSLLARALHCLLAMSAIAIAEELNRLDAEILRLEQRIATGHSGIVDHILLAATRRTHASASQAMEDRFVERATLQGIAPIQGLSTLAPNRARGAQPARALQSGTHRKTTAEFWVPGIGGDVLSSDPYAARQSAPPRLALRAVGGRR